MFENFDLQIILRSLPYLFLQGMAFTLQLTAIAAAAGIVLGTLLALARRSRFRLLARIAGLYVDLMRSLPLVLVIFWFYFLVPYVLQWMLQTERPVQVGALASSIVTFSLFEAAFFCEILRAGLRAVPPGQGWAAQALGMTPRQVMGFVVLPQAFRKMVPALLTQLLVLFQDTSLVYVLSITDFLGAASKIAQRDGRLVEMYLFAAIVYFAISFAISRTVQHLQRKFA